MASNQGDWVANGKVGNQKVQLLQAVDHYGVVVEAIEALKVVSIDASEGDVAIDQPVRVECTQWKEPELQIDPVEG